MSDYQVLFSGEIDRNSDLDSVRTRLARELGIDDRKARTLFSGRTVVLRSQLNEDEARTFQQRLGELGAICRIKSLGAPRSLAAQIDKDALRLEGQNEHTLKDITAAHVECPRCGHLQLESSHCARCGVDIAAAMAHKRKEDLLIEKKIRELRARRDGGGGESARAATPKPPPVIAEQRPPSRKRSSFVRDLFRRS